MKLDRKRGRKDQGGLGGGENMIKMHCLGSN